ncbi:MAG: 2Fe-2S iron-sulfur cluster-binding protein [Candidatus Micrarchaeota archaeon]|nr:2Fe-2S iron-sulfur cluster-binding protein [Candidatus Micrarchaeota archaeon]
MARVTFKNDNLTVDVPAGKSLKDVCDENGSSIPFGCRNGVCGTCLSAVNKGKDNISPADDNEKMTLEGFGCQPPEKRLVCQCKMGSGNEDVEIENP